MDDLVRARDVGRKAAAGMKWAELPWWLRYKVLNDRSGKADKNLDEAKAEEAAKPPSRRS